MKTRLLLISLSIAGLLTLTGATAPDKPAPTPDPAILAEYYHAQWQIAQAYAPCQAAAVEPNKARQAAIAKLQADAAAKDASIQEGPDLTVSYVRKPPPAEAPKPGPASK
jgi:hypothetical protein